MAFGTTIGVNLQFNANATQATKEINKLQTQLTNLMQQTKGSVTGGVGTKLTSELTQASLAAAQLKTSLTAAFNADTGRLDLGKFNQALAQSGTNLAQIKASLTAMGPTGQQAFNKLATSIAMAESPAVRLTTTMQKFLTTLGNTVRYQISARMFMAVISGLREAYDYAQDLNKSLNDIRIVTGKSIAEMERFAESANKAAKALRTSTTEFTNASLIYFQQGLDTEEAYKRAEVTIKMANVTGTAVKEMSDQLTAVWNNFDNGTQTLEYYADVLTALGAATASSTDEITQGLEKFASIAETVGLSYEYAAAALATVTATTRQSADIVGTAFKTLFARIQDLELGKTLEDGTTLGKYSEALDAVGINIKTANGDLKDMNSILNEMGAKWKTLSNDQQVALAQTVAGVRQYTQLVALMDNWQYMQQNVGVAESSTGTLQKQQDIYAESWEAAAKGMKASLQDMWTDLLDDDAFIKILQVADKFVQVIDTIVESMGGLKGILATISTIILTVYQTKIAATFDQLAIKASQFVHKTTLGLVPLSKAAQEQDPTYQKQQAMQLMQEGYGSSAGGQIQTNVMSNLVELQAKYLANKEKMNDYERNTYELLIQQQSVQAEKLQLSAEEAKQAERQADILTQAKITKYGHKTIQDKEGNTITGKEAITQFAQSAKQSAAATSFTNRIDTEGYLSNTKGAVATPNINVSKSNAELKEMQALLEQMGVKAGQSSEAIKNGYGPAMASSMEQFSITIDEAIEKQNRLLELQQKDPGDLTADEREELNMLQGEYDEYLIQLEKVIEAEQKLAKAQANPSNTKESIAGSKGVVTKETNKLNKTTTKSGKTVNKEQQQELKQLAELNNLKKTGAKLTADQEKEYNRLSKVYKSAGNATKDVINGQENLNTASKNATEQTKLLKEQLKNFNIPDGQLDSLAKKLQESGQKFDLANMSAAEFATFLDKLGIKIDGINNKPFTLGQKIASAGQLLSSTGMIMSSVSGLFNTLSNPDTTGLEKTIALFTTLGMLLPMINTLMNNQILLKIADAALTARSNALQATGIALESGRNISRGVAIALQKLGLATMDKENKKLTFNTATWLGNAAAKIFNAHASQGIVGVAIAAVAVGLMMATFAIAANTAKTEANTEAKIKNAEASSEAAQSAREEFKEVQDLVNAYEEQYEIYVKTAEIKSELREAATAVVNALEIENGALLIQQQRYEELAQAIRKAEREKADQAQASSGVSTSQSKAALQATAKTDKRKGVGLRVEGNKISFGYGNNNNTSDEFVIKYLQGPGKKKYGDTWNYGDGYIEAVYYTDQQAALLLNQWNALYSDALAWASEHDFDVANSEIYKTMNREGIQDSIDAVAKAGSEERTMSIESAILDNELDLQENDPIGYATAYDAMVKQVFSDMGYHWDETKKQFVSSFGIAIDKNSYDQVMNEINTILQESYSEQETNRQALEQLKIINPEAYNWATQQNGGLIEWAKNNGIEYDKALGYYLSIRPEIFGDDITDKATQLLDGLQDVFANQELEIKYSLVQSAKGALKAEMTSEDWEQFFNDYAEIFDPTTGIGINKDDFLQLSPAEREKIIDNWLSSNKRSSSRQQAANEKREYANTLRATDPEQWAAEKKSEYTSTNEYGILKQQDHINVETGEILGSKFIYQEQNTAEFANAIAHLQRNGDADFAEAWANLGGDENQGNILSSIFTASSLNDIMANGDLYTVFSNLASQYGYTPEEFYKQMVADQSWRNQDFPGAIAQGYLDEWGFESLEEYLEWEKQANNVLTSDPSKARDDTVATLEAEADSLEQQAKYDKQAEYEASILSLDLDLNEIAESADNIQALAKSSEEFADTLEKDADAAKEVAKEMARYNRAVDTLSDSYEDWMNILQNGSISEQQEIIEDLRSTYEDLLDADLSDVSTDFLLNTKNLDLMRQAAEGSTEAYNELQLILLESKLPNAVANLHEIVSADLQVGEIVVEGSNLEEQLYQLYNDAYTAAINGGASVVEAMNQANAAIEQAGFNVEELPETEIQALTITGKLPDGARVSTDGTGQVTLGNGQILTGYKYERIEGSDYEYQITGPKLKFTKKTENIGGKRYTPSSSGGGGGSKKEKKNINDEKERYHEINEVLDDLKREYDAIATAKDRAFGKTRLSYIDQEIKKQKELTEAQKQYLAEIDGYLELDKDTMRTKYGATFDTIGRITNYDELVEANVNAYNKAVEQFNAGTISEEQFEGYEKAYEQFVTDMDLYEETLNLREEQYIEYLNNLNNEIDLQLEKVNYTVELNIELNEDDLKLIEFMISNLGNSAEEATDKLEKLTQGLLLAEQNIGIYKKGIRETLKINDQFTDEEINSILNGTANWDTIFEGKTLTQDQIETIREYRDGLIESVEAMEDYKTQVEEGVLGAFDELNERMEQTNSLLEHQRTIVQGFKDIIDLVGADNLGISEQTLKKMQDSTVALAKTQVTTSKTILDTRKRELASAQDELDKAIANSTYDDPEQDPNVKYWRKTVGTITESVNEAEAEFMSSWTDALQAAADAFQASVEQTIKNFEKAMSGAYGTLEALQEAFDRSKELNEFYLEDYEKIYNLSKLNREVEKSISDTNSVNAKIRLRDIQEEILEMQESGAEVTQYEVDALRAKYELRLAEIALEEAQNAKSQVRMSRDSEGNWSYVYTADEKAVDNAQQNYEDKLYAYQNLTQEYIQDIQERLMAIPSSLSEAIAKINSDMTLSEDERQKKIKETTEFHKIMYSRLVDQLGISMEDAEELYNIDWAKYSELTGYKISANEDWTDSWDETTYAQLTGFQTMEEAQEQFVASTEQMMVDLDIAWSEYQFNIEGIMDAAGTSVGDFATTVDEKLDIANTAADETRDKLKEMGDAGATAFETLATDSGKWLTNYQKNMAGYRTEIEKQVNALNELLNKYAEVDRANQKMGESYEEEKDNGGAKAGAPTGTANTNGKNKESQSNVLTFDLNAQTAQKWLNARYGTNLVVDGLWGNASKTAATDINANWKTAQDVVNYMNSRKSYKANYYDFKAKEWKPIAVPQNSASAAIQKAKDYTKTNGQALKVPQREVEEVMKSIITAYKFDTGGYTGTWDSTGRLAVLHQKELVLNAHDTENFLSAVNILRDIAQVIDLRASAQAGFLGQLAQTTVTPISNQVLEQEITIHAEFPNATDRNEIQEAFNTLLNHASQFANRKN